jgi:hypothetical protein
MKLMQNLDRLRQEIVSHELFQTMGKLSSATGMLLTCTLPAAVGDQ